MEITVRDGDREITVRDKRAVVEPDTLGELLAAVHAHLDGDGETVAVLPFGFTALAADQSGEDEEGPGGSED